MRTKLTTIAGAIVALVLMAMAGGCSHQAAGGSDALAQQRAGVMGAPAPPAVQAQIQQQLAQRQAAAQAGQQQAQAAAQQGAQSR